MILLLHTRERSGFVSWTALSFQTQPSPIFQPHHTPLPLIKPMFQPLQTNCWIFPDLSFLLDCHELPFLQAPSSHLTFLCLPYLPPLTLWKVIDSLLYTQKCFIQSPLKASIRSFYDIFMSLSLLESVDFHSFRSLAPSTVPEAKETLHKCLLNDLPVISDEAD